MGFARRTLRFGGGLILGAAVGTAVSMLLTPQSGEELQAELLDRREEAMRAGEEAELLEQERLKRAYRVAVNDPLALTGKFDGAKPSLTAPAGDKADKVAARAIKERQEAEKAEREARKAEEDLRKAEEQARKAREKAAKEATEAAKAKAEAGVRQ